MNLYERVKSNYNFYQELYCFKFITESRADLTTSNHLSTIL